MNRRTCRFCKSYIDPEEHCEGCRRARDTAKSLAPFECILHGRVWRRHPNARYCGALCRERFWKERRRLKLPGHVRGCRLTGRLAL